MNKNKPTRKERIKELFDKLSNMSKQQRSALADQMPVVNVEGRTLSLRNQELLYLQIDNPTIVGGYNQWRENGRQVKKGQTGSLIWFPVGLKNDDGEIEDAERFYTGVVFDISQTEKITEGVTACQC